MTASMARVQTRKILRVQTKPLPIIFNMCFCLFACLSVCVIHLGPKNKHNSPQKTGLEASQPQTELQSYVYSICIYEYTIYYINVV